MNVEHKLDIFYRNSIDATTKEIDLDIAEYDEQLNEELRAYELKKKEELVIRINQQKMKIKNALNKEFSDNMWENKSLFAKIRTSLRQELFDSVKKEISAHKEESVYVDELNKNIAEVIKDANNEKVVFYFNNDDMDLINKLKIPENSEILEANINLIGGFRAVIPSQNIMIDKSYMTALQKQESDFYYEIGDGEFI